jgi:hypothetical protein
MELTEKVVNDDEIADFQVNLNMCYQCQPCDHTVTLILKDGTSYESDYVNAQQIAHLFLLFNKELPEHFQPYATNEQQQWLKPITRYYNKPFKFSAISETFDRNPPRFNQ